jgi:tRNA pseudouridine55 synthase
VVDKAAGWTSHDVVAKARGVLGTRKVGHSGTLDPDATGVLLLGVGRATRILRFLDVLPKTYTGQIVFGTETDTLDASGTVTVRHEMAPIDLAAAQAAAAELTGDIEQVPPMVSAVRVDGKRLHQLARAGIEVERKARPVTVHRFELVSSTEPMVLDATVTCSSGTFIRVLAADLGRLLGGGAHLRDLRRTAIGSFTVAEAHPVDQIELLPAAAAFRDFDLVEVDDSVADDIRHGRVLDAARFGRSDPGPYPVVDSRGTLLAVYIPHRGDTLKPAVVVADPIPKAPIT